MRLSFLSAALGLLLAMPAFALPWAGAAGVGSADFERAASLVEGVYGPQAREMGHQLRIRRFWATTAVDAWANQLPTGIWEIRITGGLARHPRMTRDGLVLILCHEMGHFLGGEPKDPRQAWMSVEGQADDFATRECFPRIMAGQDHRPWARENEVPADVLERCEGVYPDQNRALLCARSVVAGMAGLLMLQETFGGDVPAYGESDPTQTLFDLPTYPSPQCRLDTYLNAALGAPRPRCWHL